MNDLSLTPNLLQADVARHLTFTLGKDAPNASPNDWRMALSYAIRDRVVSPWFASTRRTWAEDRKRVYYLSMEFLIGRLLEDATINLGLRDVAADNRRERVSITDLMRAMEARAVAALILFFSLPNALPAIPGTSAVLGLPLIYLSTQMMMGRDPWLPQFIAGRSMSREAIEVTVSRTLAIDSLELCASLRICREVSPCVAG